MAHRRSQSGQSSSGRKAIRYAVIGLGHIAQAAVLPAFKHAKRNSTLAALVSSEKKKLQQLGRRYKVANLCGYSEVEQLFASGEIDAVYIALPNHMHCEYTLLAAGAGLHVLCEKPMAVTARECEAMIRATRKAGVKLMIAYRLHFERANLEAAQQARHGRLGELRFFSSDFSMQVRHENIRLKRAMGGGPLYDIGVYCINAGRYCLGEDPIKVWATATRSADRRFREVPETVSAVMGFKGERLASFTCSFGAADRSTYTITGTRGSLTMDPAYEYAEGLSYRMKVGERTRTKTFGKSDQFAPELMHFSDCILSGREPPIEGASADATAHDATGDPQSSGSQGAEISEREVCEPVVVMRSRQWDVVIVGAGAAGLSAALVLGRACRKVLVCDKGTPRNWASKQMHSFVTRDGIDPTEFRAIARKQLARYKQVTFCAARVTGASVLQEQGFRITIEGAAPVRCRKLLLATGVIDHLPAIEGIEDFFGVSVFQCPYCHGWEERGAPIAVYGRRQRGFEMARAMTAWTDDIVLCTDGPSPLSPDAKDQLHRNGIQIHSGRIARLQGHGGRLKSIVFRDGSTLQRAALFFDTPSTEQSNLARSIGCEFSAKGGIKCSEHEASSVPGVFVAGNITRDVQLAIVAASEGAKAAFGINRALTREDFARRVTGKNRVEHPLPDTAMSAGRRRQGKSR